MGASRFWLSLTCIVVLIIVAIMQAGKQPRMITPPYDGPYFELQQRYNSGDSRGYNDLVVEYNFDPAVLKLKNLPRSM